MKTCKACGETLPSSAYRTECFKTCTECITEAARVTKAMGLRTRRIPVAEFMDRYELTDQERRMVRRAAKRRRECQARPVTDDRSHYVGPTAEKTLQRVYRRDPRRWTVLMNAALSMSDERTAKERAA